MKAQFILLSLMIACTSYAAPDDLLLQTRVDEKSINFLIEKTRLIITNGKRSDGTEGTVAVNPDPVFPLGELSSSPLYQEALQSLSSIFKKDFTLAQLRIRIPKIYYKVHNIYADPINFNVADPVLDLSVTAGIQGVDLAFPEGIYIDFMVVDPRTGEMASHLTAAIAPAFVEIPKNLEPATFFVNFETIREQAFQFNLKSKDTTPLKTYIRTHVNDIKNWNLKTHQPVSAQDITINPVIVRLNNVQRAIEFDSLKPIVQSQMDKILDAVFIAVGDSLAGSLGKSILTTVFRSKVRSDIIYQTPALYTRYATQSFEQPNARQLRLNLAGEFCTKADFAEDPTGCVEENFAIEPIRPIPEEVRKAALEEITQKIDQHEADVGLSVSEEYLNRLLKTTISAGLWKPFLEKNHLQIGPRGAFLVLNQETKTPDLYIDLYYVGSNWFQRLFINEDHPLRFPIRISTSMHFEAKEETPALVIQTEKILSTRDEIIDGIPEFEMDSDLLPILKRWTAKKILKLSRKIEGRRAFVMELPIFRRVGLEKTWTESSQHGRVQLYFKL